MAADKQASRDRVRSLVDEQLLAIREITELGLSLESVVDEVEFADLLRFVQGQIQYASLSYLQLCDPARPRMFNPQYLPWNWGVSNADTLYASAAIGEPYEYRIYGRLGSASENTFGIYGGISADSASSKLNAKDMQIGADGSFELFITADRRGPNWLQGYPGMETFACYQVFGDWATQEKGEIYIECLNANAHCAPTGLEETAVRYARYLRRLKENFKLWVSDIPAMMFSAVADNGFLGPFQPPVAQQGTFFTGIKWKLDPGEALLIDIKVPHDCVYSGVTLSNSWSQMLDIDVRQTSLNLNQWSGWDGNVRLLLSTRDHGVRNWLDASGYSRGIATWRITQAEAPEPPVVTVIGEAQIRDHFPAEAFISASDRNAHLARRRAHFRKLYSV